MCFNAEHRTRIESFYCHCAEYRETQSAGRDQCQKRRGNETKETSAKQLQPKTEFALGQTCLLIYITTYYYISVNVFVLQNK